MIKRHAHNNLKKKKKQSQLNDKKMSSQTKNYLIKSLKEGKYGPTYYPYNCSCEKEKFPRLFHVFSSSPLSPNAASFFLEKY